MSVGGTCHQNSDAARSTSSVAAEDGGAHSVDVQLVTPAGVTLAPGVSITANVVDANSGTATSGLDYSVFGVQGVTFGAGSGNGATCRRASQCLASYLYASAQRAARVVVGPAGVDRFALVRLPERQ